MAQQSETTVTRLRERLQSGDRAALDRLFPLVYGELRALAHAHRRRWHGDETLGTTALVHEAYLKLVGQQRLSARNRAHLLALAGRAMRHILSNYAEARGRLKRGGGLMRASPEALDGVAAPSAPSDEHTERLAALERALRKGSRKNKYRLLGAIVT